MADTIPTSPQSDLQVASSFSYKPTAGVCYRRLDFLGFPKYKVGDNGKVWSLKTNEAEGLRRWRRLRGHKRIAYVTNRGVKKYASRFFNLHKTPKGARPGERACRRDGTIFTGHKLVLLAFFGPCPAGMECRHLNGNPLDNRLENLAWGTRQQNEDDKDQHDSRPRGRRTWCASVGLDDQKVAQIKLDWNLCELQSYKFCKSRSAQYGVSHNVIYCIITGRNWRHVIPEVRLRAVVPWHSHGAILGIGQVEHIKRLWNADSLSTMEFCRQAAEWYGVCAGTIFAIISGITWPHLQPTVLRKAEPAHFLNCKLTKLTGEQVVTIRRDWSNAACSMYRFCKTMGPLHGVTPHNIKLIIKGKTWRHLLVS